MTLEELAEIEAIKMVKYKYFRSLDCKRWDELAECLDENVSAAYDSGKYSYEGREALMGFLRESLGSAAIVSLHQGHHPEIELLGADRARGRWYLEDYLIFSQNSMRLRGAAFYSDEYVKRDGRWLIAKTGYRRSFEEIHSGESGATWNVTRMGDHFKDD